MTACGCGAELNPRNSIGVCLECRHIQRDAAAGFTAAEVPVAESRASFMAVFRGRFRRVDANEDGVYMRGACRRCGRFRARHDSGCCEWCGGPRRFPPKRRPKRTTSAVGGAGR